MNKTKQVTVGDQQMDVELLPKDIRDSIDFFDKIGNDMLELADDITEMQYQHNVYFVAANGMRNKISADIDLWVKENTPKTEEAKPMKDVKGETDE